MDRGAEAAEESEMKTPAQIKHEFSSQRHSEDRFICGFICAVCKGETVPQQWY